MGMWHLVLGAISMTQLSIAIVAAVLFVIFLFFIIWANRYVKVGPNQVLVVSGRAKKILDVDGIARRVGFRLVASSEVNANPKDTKDHPEGVWTLPPTLRLKDQNRELYVAIGESDRMTLLFQKPAESE